jgi:hypothetical protein
VGKGEEALMKLVVERDVDEVASAGLSLGHVVSRTSLELELKTAPQMCPEFQPLLNQMQLIGHTPR